MASRTHLLIADPDPARATALAGTLAALEYTARRVAAWPDDALWEGPDRPALLLLSGGLAAADDFARLETLRRRHPDADLPVLVYGSAADASLLGRAVRHGATDYLILSQEANLLGVRIRANLEKARFRVQARWYLEAFNEMEALADDLRLKILPLGIALSVEKDFDRLLELIVAEAMAICHADAATLYLRTEDDTLAHAIVRHDSLGLAYGGPNRPPVPFTPLPLRPGARGANATPVATHVAETGTSINIANVYTEPGFDFTALHDFDRQHDYRTVSSLTVPLRNHEVIGVLQLSNAQDSHGRVIPFDPYHQLVAESLASQATVVLHNHILTQRHEELLGFRRELEIARRVQAGFLPVTLPQPPGWEIVADLHPALMVSGDFYDSFTLSDGQIGLVIADVCDKGVAAAMFMALVRSLIRAFIMQHHHLRAQRVLATAASRLQRPLLADDTAALLNAITLTNEYIGRNHFQTHMFATLFFGVLDTARGALTYVNAGHNPPLLQAAGGHSQELAPTGPAVGLRTNVSFGANTVTLDAGDLLFLYTDGVTEARDVNRQQFGRHRLLPLLAPPDAAAARVARVMAAVQEHVDGIGQYDDIAVLAVRRQPPEEQKTP